MRALRVRAPKSWAGDPNPEALAPITRLTEHPGIWGLGTSPKHWFALSAQPPGTALRTEWLRNRKSSRRTMTSQYT
ncbi:uncharacterized protein LOC125153611 isoform X3 [Prionailurus viverrinus]|uniref:uncharacterized protein COX7A1 isoform X3 n=1 Tax=Felis catus TaxID=9685 RepID=UPI001D1A1264|nr:uncharacterized protein COX7A1 isoform X3 [Felis catus]XP_047692943.1 uncharacterized protein LOC125153611 isoform X3 [Prionailurus viverrinus]XP_060508240.1 uncharacterized protein LOC132691034 isoform X3 [Panthera onca]